MNIPAQALPHVLRRIRDVGGMDAVLKFTKALGGRKLFIPRHPVGDGHPLAIAGRAVADMLVEEFGHAHVEIPRGIAHIRLMIAREIHAGGGSNNEVAAAAEITHRRAKQLRQMVRRKKHIAPVGRPKKRAARQRNLI